jgi:hypothetical protein
MSSRQPKRTVSAPSPSSAAGVQANRVLSVVLAADEDVQWITTIAPDGSAFVSGYTIIKKPRSPTLLRGTTG